jgi:hypothetical protein
MPIETALWTVGETPEPLLPTRLPTESLLERMIIAAPRLLSDAWLLIGQQVQTDFGGRIDLLALTPDGSLVVIELKREMGMREAVAQALDYASWAEDLKAADLREIHARFTGGRGLADDFAAKYGFPLDEETLNESHQIVLVVSSLDAASERVVGYLSERGIPINVLFFQVFQQGTQQILARSWLLDPAKQQEVASTATFRNEQVEPWNGEYYASFGQGAWRDWNEAVRYGFISAGGGVWYSRTLSQLTPDCRVWVRVPQVGYVGVGRVTGTAVPFSSFQIETPEGLKPASEVLSVGTYNRTAAPGEDWEEYFVPVKWLETVPVEKAVHEVGLFGNQNTVARPTTEKWRKTVEFLKTKFLNHGG